MSSIETELDRTDQTAPTEANAAASTANDDDKEVDMIGGDNTDTDESELLDYNEQEAVEAAEKAARKKALKEMLTNNGFTLRNLLRTEHVKAHYISPLSKEDEMSVEDILSEIPKKDLHEVGIVQGRIFVPASFV
jgi:hypothetical protein